MDFKKGIYRHYKGGEYRVLFVAKGQFTDSHDMEDIVIYESLAENAISQYWARPLKDFVAEVGGDGILTSRFSFIREA